MQHEEQKGLGVLRMGFLDLGIFSFSFFAKRLERFFFPREEIFFLAKQRLEFFFLDLDWRSTCFLIFLVLCS